MEGNLTLLVDGNGNATRWAYDARYWMLKMSYADGTSYAHGYDDAGNLASGKVAKNFTTIYVQAAGRRDAREA